MIDQAYALRNLVKDKANYDDDCLVRQTPYTVAITSGKGGVGKTSLAVNLAITIAGMRGGARLIDADFGLSNAEVLLSVTPRYTLEDVALGRVAPADAWTQYSNGLKLISSGSGLDSMANIDGVTSVELMKTMLDSASGGDIVIIDTAPGIDDSVINLLSHANEVLIVTTPEPTSITDSYASIKVLTQANPDSQITLVSNCCANPSQAGAVANGLDVICRRFLGRSFQRHEYIPFDSAVGRGIVAQKPFITQYSHTPAASWLRKLAIKLTERERQWQSSRTIEALVEA